jgi:hypothetical protein
MADQTGHIPYQILSQDLTEELAPNGTFQDAWRIAYQGPSGTVAYVRILASQYSPANVDALIQTELAKIEAVHALGTAPPEITG